MFHTVHDDFVPGLKFLFTYLWGQ